MTQYDEYIAVVVKLQIEHPTWRSGQTHFNALSLLHHEFTAGIRDTHLDPFYNDGAVPAFLHHVRVLLRSSSLSTAT